MRLRMIAAILLLAMASAPVEARKALDANGNPVGRYICGLVQRLHFHLPQKYNVALNWADLPHTTAQPGAVVVQRRKGRALGGGPGGHVARIIRLTGECHAIVSDDRGQYERDICKNLVAYVMP